MHFKNLKYFSPLSKKRCKMNMQISLKRICHKYDNPKDACPLTEEKTTSFMIIKQGR